MEQAHKPGFWHPKSGRRCDRLSKFGEASGEKYCHAQLMMLGMLKHEVGDDLESAKEEARRTWLCKKESVELERCWCGKFVNGELAKPTYEAVKE